MLMHVCFETTIFLFSSSNGYQINSYSFAMTSTSSIRKFKMDARTILKDSILSFISFAPESSSCSKFYKFCP